MRTYHEEGRRSRTPVDIIADALALLHQDVAEYAFAGLIGAVAAAFTAVILSATGDVIGKGLIAPAVFGIALLTYAHTCAAIRRAQDNLEPDAVRAFFSVIARLHSITQPMTLPLAVSGVSVLVAAIANRWAPDSVLTLAVIVVFAVCGLSAYQRALYVPALFARNVSAGEARTLGGETMRKAGALVGACFVIALAPAGLFALVALSAGFGTLSTGVAAFAFVACMPAAAAVAAIIFEAIAPQSAQRELSPSTRHLPYGDDPMGEEAAARVARRLQ